MRSGAVVARRVWNKHTCRYRYGSVGDEPVVGQWVVRAEQHLDGDLGGERLWLLGHSSGFDGGRGDVGHGFGNVDSGKLVVGR